MLLSALTGAASSEALLPGQTFSFGFALLVPRSFALLVLYSVFAGGVHKLCEDDCQPCLGTQRTLRLHAALWGTAAQASLEELTDSPSPEAAALGRPPGKRIPVIILSRQLC